MLLIGGWNLDEIKGCNLPQKVRSAFTAIIGEMIGADYGAYCVSWLSGCQWYELSYTCNTEAYNSEHGEANCEDDNS
ncbi:MAG: hypothetical protein IJU48_02210 [Synergistaceae bacterium]|nr:hypothetical protein [Synergistaceae bacterium]